MAKILGRNGIDRAVSKVVELANEYVINGHVYDKNTLAPRPLEFVATQSSGHNEILLYKTMRLDTNWQPNTSMQTLAIDNEDPSITYVFYISNYSNLGMQKIKRLSKGMEIVGTKDIGSTAVYDDVFEVMAQDSQRIWIKMHRSYENHWAYVYGINKDTLNVDFTLSYGRSRLKLIKETDSSLYISQTYDGNSFRIVKVGKIDGKNTVILTDNMAGWHNLAMPTDIDENNSIYITRDSISISATNTLMYRRYEIDFDTDVVNASDVTLDLEILSPTNPKDQVIKMNGNTYTAYESFFLDSNGDRYLNLIIFDYGLQSTHGSAGSCGLYTFRMDTLDTMTLVDYKSFYPRLFRGFMPLYHNKVLLLADERGVVFFNWSPIHRRFDKTNSRDIPCMTVGADMGNNIWLQYRNGEVDLFANTLPIKIEADFLHDEYNFMGEEINSSVFIRAENYLGNRLATQVELSLIGDVEFTENGLKRIVKTTNETEDLIIPVTIKGPGMLQVNVALK